MGRRASWSIRRIIALAGAGLGAALLGSTPLAHRVEELAWDARFQLRGPRASDARVVVVLVDEPTLAEWDEPLVFLGSRLAQVIRTAHAGGARSVGLDFVPDFDADSYLRQLAPDLESTPILDLESAIAEADGTVVLARTLGAPILPNLAAAAGGRVAIANVAASRDGVVRENLAAVAVPGEVWPGFAAAVADRAPPPGRYGINYVGREPPTLSAADVAAGRVDPNVFRDAAVLIGSAYEGSNDFHRTPLHVDRPGVLVLADAVATWIDGRPVRRWPAAAGFALALFTGVLAAAAGTAWPVRRAVGGFALAAAGWAAVAHAAWVGGDWMLPVAGPIGAVGVVGAGALALRAIREAWMRQRLQARFGALLPEPALADLESTAPAYGAPPVVRPAAILFVDVRGFTTLAAETPDLPALALRTNRLMDRIAGAIVDGGGHVVGFLGDGLFASFGAVGSTEGAPDAALAVARRLVDEVIEAFNDGEGLRGAERWSLGVGLHRGPVAAGFVGSAKRHQYTLLGDTVNVASRVEGFAKPAAAGGLDARIVASAEFVAGLARPDGLAGPTTVPVKGRGSMDLFHDRPIGDGGVPPAIA